MEQYQKIKLLGEGATGRVYMVSKDGQTYAMKTISVKDDNAITNLNEIDIMSRIKHPNVMHLIEFDFSFTEIPQVHLVMPIGDYTLSEYIILKNPSYNTRIRLFYEITSAIHFLNHNGILHSDLKPDNIIIKDNKALVTDFGLSLYLPSRSIPRTTIYYQPPEVTSFFGLLDQNKKNRANNNGTNSNNNNGTNSNNNNGTNNNNNNNNVIDDLANNTKPIRDEAVDPWSLGCVFYYILTGTTLFPEVNDLNVYHEEGTAFLTKKYRLNEEELTILNKLLAWNPVERSIDIFSYPLLATRNYNVPILGTVITNSVINDFSCHRHLEVLINWIVKVGRKDDCSAETMFCTCEMIHQTFSRIIDVGKSNKMIQLLGICCYFIISNLIELFPIGLEDCLYICDGQYNREDFIRMQAKIIKELRGVLYTNGFYAHAFSLKCLQHLFDVVTDCESYQSTNVKDFVAALAERETTEERENRQNKDVPLGDLED